MPQNILLSCAPLRHSEMEKHYEKESWAHFSFAVSSWRRSAVRRGIADR